MNRIVSGIVGLAILMALSGCGGREGTSSPLPVSTSAGASPADPVTISSPAFADGAPLPVRYTCQGEGVPPPLAWSAPSTAVELALVLDDPDAPGGLFIHWTVTGIAAGSGATADGQVPSGGHTLPNSAGSERYFAPCPPADSGVHHYRFTVYELPAPLELPAGATPVRAVQAIAAAASAQARLTATFQR